MISGSLLVLVLVTQTIIAMFQRPGTLSRFFQFWSWVAAAETAAWRLKWISIPVLFVTLFFGLKLYRSIRFKPERFCGIKYGRRGLLASATVGLLIAFLIGITVPARYRQRRMSIEAENRAQYYALDFAFQQYKKLHKRLPDASNSAEELSKLPDPSGIIAAALKNYDSNGYVPRGEVAAVDTQQGRNLRGSIIRKVSQTTATDDLATPGLAFIDYDIRLPGEDKILGNDDDWIGHDGVITKITDVAKGAVGRSVSAGILNP